MATKTVAIASLGEVSNIADLLEDIGRLSDEPLGTTLCSPPSNPSYQRYLTGWRRCAPVSCSHMGAFLHLGPTTFLLYTEQ